MNLEYYSNAALVAAVVIYLLAMTAHAAEWAAARRSPVEEPTSDRELAGVGAAVSASAAGAGSVGSAGAAGAGSSAGRVADGIAAGGAGGLPNAATLDADLDRRVREMRVELWGRIGVALTLIGFLLSLTGTVLRGVAAGRPPWGNMYEFTITAMTLVVGVYLVMLWRAGARWLGLPVTLLAAVGNGLAVTVFYVAVAPLVPALHSVWFIIHIVAAAVAGAAFNVGALLTVVFLVRQRAEKRGKVGGYLARIPNARKLDLLAYRFHAFAFPLWTFTVAAGAIWAEYAWGRYWGWDPKETWALVTWVIYACYLHARSTAGWRGTRAAVIALIGVASFWFNFVGINLLVSGLHSYAGI
ncbi:putative cytochrome c biogenesis protein ResC [Microlunatus phosphovorus NM-1]|uniref:Putative cytochrome c biogenesis protein ResC n=1 Tax=Microlunatus phosphovorus (strain ATCC 700054 / DSM 10555 / JCM 9379 / NBRC 101784 / NCIMB 13414 / VKM Ac-1990 / NM-1) TaxID=1032480 RepID=F5XF67_MICPN|nr:c-type cytochrome biogenesis protein CcsB [Microlunatus phosphovorus]BAK37805.1 putative cytochrome c biogenesis protein ResC [Microlunatus phosphovorus NM-1]